MQSDPALTMDDIPKRYRKVCEIIGIKGGLELARTFGGEKLYIPQTKRISAGLVHQKIRSEFTGANVDALARKYGYTTTWIREIVGAKKADPPKSGAISLKDFSPAYRKVCRVIGVEAAVKLSNAIGGRKIFVPEMSGALSRKRKREAIRRNYNGHNVRDLAFQYGYTVSWVKQIVKQDS